MIAVATLYCLQVALIWAKCTASDLQHQVDSRRRRVPMYYQCDESPACSSSMVHPQLQAMHDQLQSSILCMHRLYTAALLLHV